MRHTLLVKRIVPMIIEDIKYKQATVLSLQHLALLCQNHADMRGLVLQQLTPEVLERLLISNNNNKTRSSVTTLLHAVRSRVLSAALTAPAQILPELPAHLARRTSLYHCAVQKHGTDTSAARDTSAGVLAFDPLTMSADARLHAHKLWRLLLLLMPRVRNFTRGEQIDQDKGIWHLSSYFYALRWLLYLPEQQTLFRDMFSDFYALFADIDKHELIHDDNKSELILLLLKFVTGSPTNLDALCNSPDTIDRLMNWSVASV